MKDLPLPILLASIQTFLAEDRQIFFDTTLRKDIIDLSSQFRTDQDLIPFLKHEIRNRVDKSQLKECKLFFGATKR